MKTWSPLPWSLPAVRTASGSLSSSCLASVASANPFHDFHAIIQNAWERIPLIPLSILLYQYLPIIFCFTSTVHHIHCALPGSVYYVGRAAPGRDVLTNYIWFSWLCDYFLNCALIMWFKNHSIIGYIEVLEATWSNASMCFRLFRQRRPLIQEFKRGEHHTYFLYHTSSSLQSVNHHSRGCGVIQNWRGNQERVQKCPKATKQTNYAAELGMGMLFHGAGRFNHA